MFIDEAKIHVKAGTGGKGCVSFRREKSVPKGGPDGGDGGRGGSIYLITSGQMTTLLDFHYSPHLHAENGANGSGSNKSGKSGRDLIIKVPMGTVVKDFESGKIIADLVKRDEKICIAQGGRGGRGNARFVSSTHQAPRQAEDGNFGDEKLLLLELKLIADVGLVGLPNAGKSTLLSRISHAKPKIAEYPFTTLNPILGQVRLDEGKSFIVADIPGLIENAHQGSGLGHEFLRHIERTRILIHLVDILPPDKSDPLENFQIINHELQLYNPTLVNKPQIVILNKIDLLTKKTIINKIKKELISRGYPVYPISAYIGIGITPMLYHISEILDEIDRKNNEKISSDSD